MKIFTFAIYPYIMKKYNGMFEELINKYQITQIEIDVLAFLANNPEYTHAQDIVDKRGISKAHVSNAVEKLVKKGYITRVCDEKNRRCNQLFIHSSAMNLVREIQDIQHQFNDLTYANMSQEDIEEYHRLLHTVYQNLGGGKDE